jgi:hypothetical protein
VLKRLLGQMKYRYSPEARRWRELLRKLDPDAVRSGTP